MLVVLKRSVWHHFIIYIADYRFSDSSFGRVSCETELHDNIVHSYIDLCCPTFNSLKPLNE